MTKNKSDWDLGKLLKIDNAVFRRYKYCLVAKS